MKCKENTINEILSLLSVPSALFFRQYEMTQSHKLIQPLAPQK